jgi:probable phosphoglycerate mutase
MYRKKIYIIRHGQTEFNRMGMVQGSGVDSNLNALGHAQGEAFFMKHQHTPFDKVYTSTLRRTHQTVAKFVNKGVAWEQLQGLDEISWGNKEGRPITTNDNEHHQAMLSAWKRGELHWKVEGGESPWDVHCRQVAAWTQIMANVHEKHVLVCMHGRAMRILLCYLLGHPMSEMDSFEHTNTCLYLLEYEGGRYTLVEANNTDHFAYISLPEEVKTTTGC